MKILLVNSPIGISDHEVVNRQPPLGLLYIASYLKKFHSDWRVEILDAPGKGMGLASCCEAIKAIKFDILGINILTALIHNARKVISTAKAQNHSLITVIGGVHVTLSPETCIQITGADFAICGEGEEKFGLLLDKLQEKSISTGGGNTSCHSGKIIPKNNLKLTNLNELPFPDYNLVNLKNYSGEKGLKGFIITARGCPQHCTYCCSPKLFDNGYRIRSIDNIAREIHHQVDRYSIKEMHFLDDSLTVSERRVADICDVMKDSGISWRAISRVDIQPHTIKLMASAGCYKLSFGIESAVPSILTKINKRIDIVTAETTIKLCYEAGIKTKAFFMIGFPFERPEQMVETMNFAVRLSQLYDTECGFNLVKVYPGTKLAEEYPGACEDVETIDTSVAPAGYRKDFLKYCDIPTRIVNPFMTRDSLIQILLLAFSATKEKQRVSFKDLTGLNSFQGYRDSGIHIMEKEISLFVEPLS